MSIVHGQASATTSTVTASPVVIPTSGTTTLTVQLKDAGGNNITTGGENISFDPPSSGSIGTVTDNGDGSYTAVYTAGTSSGTVTITPQLNGINFSNPASLIVALNRIKANNTTVLITGSSWVGGVAPDAQTIGTFDATFASASTLGTGGPLSWLGLRVTGGSSLIYVENQTANYVGILEGGIDMSSASRNVQITSFQQQANHTWHVPTGRTLTVGNNIGSTLGIFSQANGSILALSGGGTISISRANADISIGDASTFSGNLNTNGSTIKLLSETGDSRIFTGKINNSSPIAKAGAGTYELSNQNSLGSSVNVISGTLLFSNTNTFAGNTLTKTGSGMLALTGTNTYSGITTISAGTLQIGNGGVTGTIGAGDITMGNGSILAFNRSDNVSLGNTWTGFNTVNGSYYLQNEGGGLLTLSDGNKNIGSSVSGTTVILGGSGNGRMDQSLASGGGLGMSIRKEGTGTWTLTNSNNGYTGTTEITNGVLEVGTGNTSGKIGTGNIILHSGAVLAFNRSNAISVGNSWNSFFGGGNRTLRNDGTGLLTISGTSNNIGGSGTIGETFTLSGSGDGVIEQSLASGGSVLNLQKEGAGTWKLSNSSTNYSGTTSILNGKLEITGRIGAGNYTQSIVNDGELHINSTASQSLSGDISGAGLLRKSATGLLTLSGNNSFTGGTILEAGTLSLTSADALGSSGTITFTGGTLRFSAFNTTDYSSRFSTTGNQAFTFDTNEQTVTFSSNISSTGASLTKLGLGTLELTGTNTYDATTISAGTLRIGTSNSIGTGSIELTDGTLEITSPTAITLSNDFNVFGTGSAPTLLNNGAGLLTLTTGNDANIDVDNGETFTVGGSGDILIEKSIASGGASSLLTKTGSGNVILTSPNNNWSGGTTISEGILQLGDGSSDGTIGSGNIIITNGRLSFNRSNPYTIAENFNSFQANTTPGIENNGSGLLTINASNLGFSSSGITLELGGVGDGLIDGPIASGGAQANILKDGSGKWTFNDVSTNYTGNTTIQSGTLEITGLLGQGNYGKSITNNGTLVFNTPSRQTISGTLSGTGNLVNNSELELVNSTNQTYAGAVSGSGNWIKGGTGTWIWDGANTSTGNLTINNGTLRIQENSGIPSGNIALPNGTLEFNRSSSTSFANQLFVTGTGASPTLLNNGTGLLTIQAGTSTNINVDNGETFTIGGSGDMIIEKSIATGGGASLLTKTGNGKVTLASTQNNWSGGTTISEGILEVGNGTNDGSIGTGMITITNGRIAFNRQNPYTVAESFTTFALGTTPGIENNGVGLLTLNAGNLSFNNGAELTFGGSGNGAIDGPIAIGNASATIKKDGIGTWTFNGNNGYTGLTIVHAGTLFINGNQVAASGAVTVASGARLGGSGTIGGSVTVTTGGILTPGNSPGTLSTANGLTIDNASIFEWELIANDATAADRGTDFDGVDVSGTLNIDPTAISSLVFNAAGSAVDWTDAFWSSNHSWLVFDNASTPTVSGTIFGSINVSPDINGAQLTSVTGRSNAAFYWSMVGDDIFLNYVANTVLPVTWKSFTGREKNGQVELNWETASEQNTKDFVVEHSGDASRWKAIGTVTAAGNSTSPRSYAFLHTEPGVKNFYRLLQRDLDGKQSYSSIVNVNVAELLSGIRILGNPARNKQLVIRLDKSASITITNQSGQYIYKGLLPMGTHRISMEGRAAGVYWLRADNHSKPFILE